MISEKDIAKLEKVFATKEDFATLEGKFDHMQVTLDAIAGGLQDQRMENAAGAAILYRHDRQIQALAKGTNITIPQD